MPKTPQASLGPESSRRGESGVGSRESGARVGSSQWGTVSTRGVVWRGTVTQASGPDAGSGLGEGPLATGDPGTPPSPRILLLQCTTPAGPPSKRGVAETVERGHCQVRA